MKEMVEKQRKEEISAGQDREADSARKTPCR